MAISLWSADISLMRFKSRAEARDWCKEHYPGSPVREIGPRSGGKSSGMTLSPDDPLAKPRKKAPGGKK